MKKLIRNFIIKIIILTIVIAFICGLLFNYLLQKYYFESFPLLLILFPIISALVYAQLLKASKKSLAKFNVSFMLSFMLKLIIYALFAGIIISAESGSKTGFVITMLIMYWIYTVFDTKTILEDIKKLTPPA